MTVVSASVPIDSVPGNAACSPLAPIATGGATATPASPESETARSATATAIRVSVSSGRCGPCCSSEPTGTTTTRRDIASTSGHRLSDSRISPAY